MFSRRTLTSVAAALMILVGAASARAGMMDLSPNSTVTDQINNLAAQARAAGGSSASADVAKPLMGGPAPLTKFSAAGRLTETLATGGCLNNPISATCTTCSSLTLTGTVNASGLGNSTLNICYTLDAMSSLGICLANGLGIGTLTAKNGDAVNLSFAGSLCIADENPATPPVTLFLTENLTYLVEGGTGKFLTETGTGNMSISGIFVNPVSNPIAGTGEIAITGTLSKN
jgi:hypothetical protein